MNQTIELLKPGPQEFWQKETGKKLLCFASDVAQIPSHTFPLSLLKSAGLLNFDNDKVGERSLKLWVATGLFCLIEPTRMSATELIVAKMTQVLILQHSSFYVVHQYLQETFQGTNLEHLVGQLQEKYIKSHGRVTLLTELEENGKWWLDPSFLMIEWSRT